MTTVVEPYVSVFLSYGLQDRSLASSIRESLVESGVEVFDPVARAHPGDSFGPDIRHWIAESDAIVVLLSHKSQPSANVAVEVGAATAWQKPIYVVTEQAGAFDIPAFLQSSTVFPLSRLDDLVGRLAKAVDPFTKPEETALVDAYQAIGVAADEVILNPYSLEMLTSEFRARSGVDRTGERIAKELLRLRKSSRLPLVRS